MSKKMHITTPMQLAVGELEAELDRDGFLARKSVKALIDEVRSLQTVNERLVNDFRESRDETVDLVTRVHSLEASLRLARCNPVITNCDADNPCAVHAPLYKILGE